MYTLVILEGDWMEQEARFLLKYQQVGGQIKTQEGEGQILLKPMGEVQTLGEGCCVAGTCSLR